MSDELIRAVLLYVRLVSYPAGIVGVLWLMLFRSDWRHRVTSLFYLGSAGLLAAQFATVIARAMFGESITALASDTLITPALVVFNACLWTSVIWLSRRWRHDPASWI